MSGWFVVLFVFIIAQRLIEVAVAKRNEKWMLRNGAVEVASDHYKWIVAVHVLFFVSVGLEAYGKDLVLSDWKGFLLGAFFVTQGLRIWCLTSLGRFWNTKIIILPGSQLVARGPYKWMKHPNYVVVGLEFIIIPLLFNAYMSAVLFPLLHLGLMKIRIPHEERALTKLSE
ncbi:MULTISPECIES: isoprenylcysteine carboxyl methyltransferase family protein [Pontibacillus]|uniref:Isoprenylcysteine carboxylmethyltransferase family protein n=1 Tax=Pontibacillus chungwhensis TaxID=265426 RepID=A0ABY8URM7_9BACI|nr:MULTISPECIES: isoprenylcysteine carboxylmethyltransferase family protein [Pontibacillus]MCD5322936.1 isoprenylcysteine carboxyl methyltransferase [Pontibacillus sp. HN14]WIF96330.1 isoprenylcysteine carboxylmethyltransferase family protein [Pontibacillus chungwhensis]